MLAQQHCRPQSGLPMAEAEVQRHLHHLPGWQLVDGAIEKSWKFADFHHTMAFVNAVAWIAHSQDHHPDMAVGFNRCTLRYATHSVGGLSINDFICAARVDGLAT